MDIANLNSARSFQLALDFEGEHYEGTIIPSAETAKDGTPVFYRVEFDHTLFAYLCCADNGWHTVDWNKRPHDLVNAIGRSIAAHYS